MSKDKYQKALTMDSRMTATYYRKSIAKTEQQKFLESLLEKLDPDLKKGQLSIADIACGGGTLSYHLSEIFANGSFCLVDFQENALEIAKELLQGDRYSFFLDNIYSLNSLQDDSFDLVCCWQALSWLKEPEKALQQLIRITKPGGVIYISSLFNIDHDVDVYSQVYDLTRESGSQGNAYDYNTYSARTVHRWLENLASNVSFIPFNPEIDFSYEGKGLGTYTVDSNAKKLQISGGMLMNWAILRIKK